MITCGGLKDQGTCVFPSDIAISHKNTWRNRALDLYLPGLTPVNKITVGQLAAMISHGSTNRSKSCIDNLRNDHTENRNGEEILFIKRAIT
jgi:hypothetical protein